MGFFDRFRKEPLEDVYESPKRSVQPMPQFEPEAFEPLEELPNFTLGVLTSHPCRGEIQNCIVLGTASGEIRSNDIVYLKNLGEEPLVTKVLAIYDEYEKPLDMALDGYLVYLWLENASNYPIRVGSVVYERNATQEEIQTTHRNTLEEFYLSEEENIYLTDDAEEAITATDTAELLNLLLSCEENGEEEDEDNFYNKKDLLSELLGNTLVKEESIFYVEEQGKPFLFTDKDASEQTCAMLLTKPYYSENFAEEAPSFQVHEVQNGADENGIHAFLFRLVHTYGANGIALNYRNVKVEEEFFLSPLDEA